MRHLRSLIQINIGRLSVLHFGGKQPGSWLSGLFTTNAHKAITPHSDVPLPPRRRTLQVELIQPPRWQPSGALSAQPQRPEAMWKRVTQSLDRK